MAHGYAAACIASSSGQPNLAAYFSFATDPHITYTIGLAASLLNIGALIVRRG